MRRSPIVVVGGGITGLACAHALAEQSVDFLLFERSERWGGTIRTERHEGFLLDAGPDAFLAQKPDAIALCRRLGLEPSVISTNPDQRTVYVLHRGRLHPLPEGMILTVPTRVGPFITSRLFSWGGKLRMGLEPWVPARRDGEDESISSFIERRLGRQALLRLAEPLLAGIHSGDPDRLSMRALFPRFVDLEKKYGSLIRGMRRVRPPIRLESEPKPSVFLSLERGLSQLVDTLVSKLPAESLTQGDGVQRARREGGEYHLELDSGEIVATESLVLATSLRQSERIGGQLSAELGAAMQPIPTVSTAVVFLAVERNAVRHPLDGYGFVVPRTEGRRILAGTFVSTKFPNRAPGSSVLLRVFLGGARDPDILGRPDSELVQIAHRELSDILGGVGTPLFTRVYRWPHATPQLEVGHFGRLAALEDALARLPGVQVVGNGIRGSGIPDCIADGRRAAERVIGFLAQRRTAGRTSSPGGA